jgi:hypothetical protein
MQYEDGVSFASLLLATLMRSDSTPNLRQASAPTTSRPEVRRPIRRFVKAEAAHYIGFVNAGDVEHAAARSPTD